MPSLNFQLTAVLNILFVHFNDLKADIEGEMRRVAAFLDIAVPEAAWPGLADTVSIETMRANADKILGLHEAHFKGGGKTFLHKGTNGRWRKVLDDADLALYRAALEKTLRSHGFYTRRVDDYTGAYDESVGGRLGHPLECIGVLAVRRENARSVDRSWSGWANTMLEGRVVNTAYGGGEPPAQQAADRDPVLVADD
ncbi:MAG: sulfotransferase domain-containing protein [Planctomycetes bacterium]|nr:sulfotransferase domain-containing protein [Planctomycetota bacterium]